MRLVYIFISLVTTEKLQTRRSCVIESLNAAAADWPTRHMHSVKTCSDMAYKPPFPQLVLHVCGIQQQLLDQVRTFQVALEWLVAISLQRTW